MWAITSPRLAGEIVGPLKVALVDLTRDRWLVDRELEAPLTMEYRTAACTESSMDVVGYGVDRHALHIELDGEAVIERGTTSTLDAASDGPLPAVTIDGRWRATADGSRLLIERVR